MLDLNPRYQAAISGAVLRPRITIEMHFENDGSDVVWFTSHDDIGRPQGATSIDGCVQKFSGATQKIDPKNSSSSIGSISFDLVDIDGAISTLLAQKHAEGKSPRKKKVVVYFGSGPIMSGSPGEGLPGNLDVLDWLDYQRHFTMIVKSYETGPGKYRFTAEDVQRLEEPDLFVLHKTTLLETVTAEQLYIPVALVVSSNKFPRFWHDNSYSDRPNQNVGYIRIEDEVICHGDFIDHSLYGPSFSVLERGALNTLAVGHKVDVSASDDRKTKVEEFVYLEGPALKILYAIQTGNLYGQGSNRLPDHWNQGIDPSFVRLSDYLNADPLLWEPNANTGRKLRFEGLKKENGERFISTQILAWLVGIRPVYSDGAIGFKKLSSVLTGSAYVYELNADNIVSVGNLVHKFEDVINQVSIDWDYSFLKEQYLHPDTVVDITSIRKYGEGATKRLQFKGVKSSNQTDQDLRNVFDGYRNRYAGGGFHLSVEVMPRVNMLEVGDLVRVTLDKLKDPLTGVSLDRVFEIQQLTPSTRTGRTRLSLFASTDSAGEFEELTGGTVLDDEFYTSAGTDIGSIATMVDNTIIADVTLVGGETMGDGIYYWDDHLIIASNVTVYLTDNVQLRVRGTITRNGDIVGAGRGHAGGRGGTVYLDNGSTSIILEYIKKESLLPARTNDQRLSTDEEPGIAGYFGSSQASIFSYYHHSIFDSGSAVFQAGWVFETPVINGANSSIDRLPLINRDGSGIEGLDLFDGRGTSGPGGRPLIAYMSGHTKETYNILQDGPNGGNGGASFVLICRGESVGASGVIDLSGNDGDYSPAVLVIGPPSTSTIDFSNTGGGGGQPGAYYLLLDGQSSFGSGVENVTQNRGLSGINPETPQSVIIGQNPETSGPNYWITNHQYPNGVLHFNFGRSMTPIVDIGDLGFKVQYIPFPQQTNSAPIQPPKYQLQPLISAIDLESGTPQLLGSKDGTIRERIHATFTESIEAQAHDYELQARLTSQTDADYRTVAIVSTGEAFIDVTEGFEYIVRGRVRGIDNSVIPSTWIDSTHTATGKSESPAQPTNLFADKIQDGSVLITVDAHPDADFLEFEFLVGASFASAQRIYRGNGTSFNFGVQPAGTYKIWAIAYDRSGNESPTINVDVVIERTTTPDALDVFIQVDTGLLFSMNEHPDADFKEFVISFGPVFGRTVELFRGNATRFLWDTVAAGTYNFYLVAINRAGDISDPAATTVVIEPPSISEVVITYEGESAILDLHSVEGSFAIREYKITYGETHVLQRGTRFSKKVTWQGLRSYVIEAIDIVGNISEFVRSTVSPVFPGITVATQSVVDNILQFEYEAVPGSLPIDHFDIYKGEIFNTSTYWSSKAGSSKFTTKRESVAGHYNFWWVAVDTAGNEGRPGHVVASVTQDPDYELFDSYSEKEAGFDGIKTNCIFDDGSLLFPVDTTETWGVGYSQNGFPTFQDEIAAGHELFIEPLAASASYEKVFDLGVTLNTVILDTIVGNPIVLQGSVSHSYIVSASEDGITYTDYTDEKSVLLQTVRYIRLSLTMTALEPNSLAKFSDLQIRLNLKTDDDGGVAMVSAAGSSGTFVTFNQDFIDVKKITVSASVDGAYAVWDFQDVPNPTGFYVFLKDDQGVRVDGRISWDAIGYIRGI